MTFLALCADMAVQMLVHGWWIWLSTTIGVAFMRTKWIKS